MSSTYKNILTATVILTAAFSAGSVSAQDKSDRTADQFTCKDVLRQSGPSREVAIAFVHGYLLGKSGGTKFNVAAMAQQTDAFIERCLDNPNEKVLDAMMKVQK